MQIVHRDVEPAWTIEDWRGSPVMRQHFGRISCSGDRSQPLTLTEAPAMRFALVRVAERHMEISLERSRSAAGRLVVACRVPRCEPSVRVRTREGTTPRMEPVRPYRDYLEWLSRQSSEQAQHFGTRMLAGFREPTPLLLPRLQTPGNGSGERYSRHTLQLSADDDRRAPDNGPPAASHPQHAGAGGMGNLAQRRRQHGDVVFGAAFSGRPADLRRVESIVGPFVNNLPVRDRVERLSRRQTNSSAQLHAQLLAAKPVSNSLR